MSDLNILMLYTSVPSGMWLAVPNGEARRPAVASTSIDKFAAIAPEQLGVLIDDKNMVVMEYPADNSAAKIAKFYAALDALSPHSLPVVVIGENSPEAERFLPHHNLTSCVSGKFCLSKVQGSDGLFAALRKTSVALKAPPIDANLPPLIVSDRGDRKYTLSQGQNSIELPRHQARLLPLLADGKLHGNEVVMAKGLGYEVGRPEDLRNLLKVCISKLKDSIDEVCGANKDYVRTVWGVGYQWAGPRLQVPSEP